MSETARRLKSTVSLTAVFAVIMGLSAVIQNESFKPFLLEIGFSKSLAALVAVFLYQVVAYVLNKIPSSKGLTAGGYGRADKTLI